MILSLLDWEDGIQFPSVFGWELRATVTQTVATIERSEDMFWAVERTVRGVFYGQDFYEGQEG